ncbi:MAG: hypothetical protein SAqBPW_05460 [Shewanella algae]
MQLISQYSSSAQTGADIHNRQWIVIWVTVVGQYIEQIDIFLAEVLGYPVVVGLWRLIDSLYFHTKGRQICTERTIRDSDNDVVTNAYMLPQWSTTELAACRVETGPGRFVADAERQRILIRICGRGDKAVIAILIYAAGWST